MLIGVYALHLVFFQALMTAAPTHSLDNGFNPLFVKHTKIVDNHLPSAHPAVTYYTMLVKQGNIGLRSCCSFSVIAPQIGDLIVTPVKVEFQSLYITPFQVMHLGDSVFKLYRLISVFLI